MSEKYYTVEFRNVDRNGYDEWLPLGFSTMERYIRDCGLPYTHVWPYRTRLRDHETGQIAITGQQIVDQREQVEWWAE